MKNPNGFGSCIKLTGNRRNPWGARITVGYYDNGYPKYKFISYHKTKKEAFKALCEYNANPYEIGEKMTLQELYSRWSKEHEPVVKPNTMYMYRYGWQILEPLYKSDISRIRLSDIQPIMDKSGRNAPSLRWTKTVMIQLYKYALKHEWVDASKVTMCENLETKKAGNPNKLERKPFSKEHISEVWKHKDSPNMDLILILLYTGVRISELLNLDISDIHIEDRYFYIREGKTDSAVREVPIAECLVPMFENRLKNGCIYEKSYNTFRKYVWESIMESLHMDYHIHDTRHTFVSICTELGADQRILKQIVGHKANNVTEVVYTHIDLPTKLDIVNRIPVY